MKKLLLFTLALIYSELIFSQDAAGRNAKAKEINIIESTNTDKSDKSARSQTESVKKDTIPVQTAGDYKDRRKVAAENSKPE